MEREIQREADTVNRDQTPSGNRAHPLEGYVLIVEDDAAIREALTAVLEDEGFRIQSAANGREALQLLRSRAEQPQLILLDLMMPVMNGWAFRAEQRDDPALVHIPVVILSADHSAATSARELQAERYLSKPVDFSVLIDAVKAFVRIPGAQAQPATEPGQAYQASHQKQA